MSDTVLIVPIWNRNKQERGRYYSIAGVLIVPIWNRNNDAHLGLTVVTVVLIVPIWNRNDVSETLSAVVSLRFNRTNLE